MRYLAGLLITTLSLASQAHEIFPNGRFLGAEHDPGERKQEERRAPRFDRNDYYDDRGSRYDSYSRRGELRRPSTGHTRVRHSNTCTIASGSCGRTTALTRIRLSDKTGLSTARGK